MLAWAQYVGVANLHNTSDAACTQAGVRHTVLFMGGFSFPPLSCLRRERTAACQLKKGTQGVMRVKAGVS